MQSPIQHKALRLVLLEHFRMLNSIFIHYCGVGYATIKEHAELAMRPRDLHFPKPNPLQRNPQKAACASISHTALHELLAAAGVTGASQESRVRVSQLFNLILDRDSEEVLTADGATAEPDDSGEKNLEQQAASMVARLKEGHAAPGTDDDIEHVPVTAPRPHVLILLGALGAFERAADAVALHVQ